MVELLFSPDFDFVLYFVDNMRFHLAANGNTPSLVGLGI
jgi:hypothetical protein